MKIDLRTKLEALLIIFTFVLLAYSMVQAGPTEEKEVRFYVHCVDGRCTTILPEQIKVIYK